MKATAQAHPNMALVKYWGKRDPDRMIPWTGSLSMTLGGLHAVTTVAFDEAYPADTVRVNGEPIGGQRVTRVLDAIREVAGVTARARVESRTDFPVAAGLASSAAGAAALARAAAGALGLDPGLEALSQVARLGSGSGARSLHGGFVEWLTGESPDGSDCQARQLHPASHWELRIVVAVVEAEQKEVGSTEGMARTVATSPFYPGWRELVSRDLERARTALAARDLEGLGRVAERNALAMHGSMLAADPPLCYFAPATLCAYQTLRTLRQEGIGVWLTIDAGPNPAAVCTAADAATVAGRLATLDGVERVVICPPGGDAVLLGKEADLF